MRKEDANKPNQIKPDKEQVNDRSRNMTAQHTDTDVLAYG